MQTIKMVSGAVISQGKTSHARKSQLGVQVIARAADVLRALEGSEQGLSLGQLAKQLELPKSTVQRIVAALDRENFVIAASLQAGVRLGPALARIAQSVRFELVEVVRPYLEQLAQRTGETVDLAVLDGSKAVFVDHIEGSQRLRAVSAIGISFPLHCSANGKAMLAALDDRSLLQLKKTIVFKRFTPNSICTWSQLDAELKEVRKTGIAFDLEEHTLGISAVGASIVGPEGENAAISVPTPSVRFAEKKREIEAAIIDCRNLLMERFGSV